MLSETTLATYRRDGFVVLPDILTSSEVEALRRVTDGFVQGARSVAANNEIYDLEDSHSAAEPRVRRIKTPHLHHPEYARAARHPKIVAVLKDLWGTVRFDTGKLNMKSAGYGAPIEWHQDWAFYPHTNEDLAAVGIMLDDCEMENGPMMVVPGSHRGPIYDHHGPDGRFCGAIDPNACDIGISRAAPCLGKAGSITVHHVRAVHGSATNFSGQGTPVSAVPISRRRCLAIARLQRRDREVRRVAARRRADLDAPACPGAGPPAIAPGASIKARSTRTSALPAGGFSRPRRSSSRSRSQPNSRSRDTVVKPALPGSC